MTAGPPGAILVIEGRWPMQSDIREILKSVRPKAKMGMTHIIQAADWLEWKKQRIAKVQAWKKAKGR